MKPMTVAEFHDRWAAHLFDHTTIKRIRAALEHRELVVKAVRRYFAADAGGSMAEFHEAVRNMKALIAEGKDGDA